MPALHIRPFDAGDVPAAADLLAHRHRRHRVAQPLLSPQYEDAAIARTQIEAALAADGASGAIAFRGDDVVGYVLGAPKPSPVWGPNIWVESAGQATIEAEAMRDLYAVAATRWVADGAKAHYVLVPAHDRDLVDAWFRLGFGRQHSHGIRPAPESAEAPTAKVTVRRAERADIPVLARLEQVLPDHQALAPTFSAGARTPLQESLAEWENDIYDPSWANFVAEYNGEVVGSAVGCALERSSSHTGPARPDHAAFLGFAAVFPDARGLGAGRALGEAVLAWAAQDGYPIVVTDWRTTNLLASRAWPALGFSESFLRLHRLIGY